MYIQMRKKGWNESINSSHRHVGIFCKSVYFKHHTARRHPTCLHHHCPRPNPLLQVNARGYQSSG